MIVLETQKLCINLKFRSKKIVTITNMLQEKTFENAIFDSAKKCGIDELAKIIFVFAEDLNGLNPFKSSSEVFDFIDDYKAENGKSYKDIYSIIIEGINEESFFSKKMTKEELEEQKNNIMSSDEIEKTIKTITEKIAMKMVENTSIQEISQA